MVYMADDIELTQEWIRSIQTEVAGLTPEAAVTKLAEVDRVVGAYQQAHRFLTAAAYRLIAELRRAAGMEEQKLTRGPTPNRFKIVDVRGKVPDQVRTGVKELAVFFNLPWATCLSKGTQDLKARFPDDPEKWVLTKGDYKVYLLP